MRISSHVIGEWRNMFVESGSCIVKGSFSSMLMFSYTRLTGAGHRMSAAGHTWLQRSKVHS